MKKIFIGTFIIFYFYIGTDLIYDTIHKNDKPTIDYKYSNGNGGIGSAEDCLTVENKSYCKYNHYLIEVNKYWKIGDEVK